jgi:hypothetical protein
MYKHCSTRRNNEEKCYSYWNEPDGGAFFSGDGDGAGAGSGGEW